jgi:hypothetical protein
MFTLNLLVEIASIVVTGPIIHDIAHLLKCARGDAYLSGVFTDADDAQQPARVPFRTPPIKRKA